MTGPRILSDHRRQAATLQLFEGTINLRAKCFDCIGDMSGRWMSGLERVTALVVVVTERSEFDAKCRQ